MKFVFRWAFRLLILLIVLAVALILLKDTIAKSLLEQRIRSEAGIEAKIGKFEMDLFSPVIHIEDLVIYHPAEFGGAPFLKLPELHLEYDRQALSEHKLHFKLIRLDLAELNVVQKADGTSSIQALAALLKNKFEARAKEFQFQGIDTLNVTLGKYTFTNLKPPRSTQEKRLGIKNEIIQNVRSITDISGLLFKILMMQPKGLFGCSRVSPDAVTADDSPADQTLIEDLVASRGAEEFAEKTIGTGRLVNPVQNLGPRFSHGFARINTDEEAYRAVRKVRYDRGW